MKSTDSFNSSGRIRKFVAAASAGTLAAGLMVGFGVTTASADDNAGFKAFGPGSDSFTVPPGVETLLAEGQGGGGAGGAKVGTFKGGNGGVGAVVKASLDVSNVDSMNIRVGAGGVVGNAVTASDGGGRGGQSTLITENGGSIGFIAGGGGGGSTGYNHSSGGGNNGGDAGTGNNGAGHDGAGNGGGSGGSKGVGGKAGKCNQCETAPEVSDGTSTTGGVGAPGDPASGQGGFGGDGYGGGGGGALATSKTGIAITTKSNGGGGAGGSRADGAAIQSKFSNISKASTGGGLAGDTNPATAGGGGQVAFSWLVRPTNVKVVPGSGQITVSWSESVQDSHVTDNFETPDYQVYLDGKIQSQVNPNPAGTPITGLQNGKTYAVTVVVTSQAKTGTKYPLKTVSSTVNAGPATTPGAPGTPTIAGWGVANNDGYVSLNWTPPANNGGATITDYHVKQQSAGSTNWFQAQGCVRVTGTSCKVTGLVPEVGYKFEVIAENAIGNGTPSAASVQVAPHYVPPAPKNQSVGKCVRKPSKITLKNKKFPVLAPNCKTNAGQVVKVKATPKQTAGKKVRYSIIKINKGKWKGYMAIRTYNVKVKNLKVTWSAAAKARPVGQPTGQSYKAWSTSKTYQVR